DHFFFAADDRLLQGEALLYSDVGATPGALAPAALRGASGEKLGKKVLELGKNIAHSGTGKIERAFDPGVTELVVTGSFLPIGQDAERFCRLFELGGGPGIIRVAVWMVLE